MTSFFGHKGRLFAGAACAASLLGLGAPALADDGTLAELLAKKGILTAAEASSLSAGPAATREERLVALLRSKGVLEASDMKALGIANSRVAGTREVQPKPALPANAIDVSARAAASSADLTGVQPRYAKSPLAVDMWGLTITPLGFIDVTGVWRSRNTGSNLATSFGAVPFENTIQGNIGETRISAQNSRFALKAEGTYLNSLHLLGYLEGDFAGNDAANVFVTTNSHTARLRQAFFDFSWGQWEFTGGQAYSWMTPNRTGLSPNPTDVFQTLNVDQSLQVGLAWTRAAQARIVYHATPNLQFGVAVENPDQFVGAGEVIFPFAFNAALGPQFDAANQTTVPNAVPDVIAKGAFDDTFYGRKIHLEVAGMAREFKVTNVPIGDIDFVTHRATGWAAQVAGNVEILPGFSLVGNAYHSKGGGRYLGGLGPDVVVRPEQLGPTAFDIGLSTVEFKCLPCRRRMVDRPGYGLGGLLRAGSVRA